MKNRAFIDSDIILDLLTKREPFYHDAAKLFSLSYEKKVELFTSAVVFMNVFYILRKIRGNEEARKQLRELRLLIQVAPIDEKTVDMALNSKFRDFEDGLQYFSAKQSGIPTLITRNTADYREKDLIIQASNVFLKINYPSD